MRPGESRRDVLDRVRRGELGVAEAAALLAEQASGQLTLFKPGWTRADLAEAPRASSAASMIVVDHSISTELMDQPGVVVRAVPGSQFTRSGRRTFHVGVDDDSAWARLWDELLAEGRIPEQVVVITAAAPEQCLDAAYPLVRSLIRERVGDYLRIAFVAVGTENEQVADALGAFCQIAGLEDRRLHLVAISPLAVDVDLSALVNLGLDELAVAQPGLAQVRHQGGGRSVRSLQPIETPAVSAGLRRGGVFLLAGGAGGIGLQVAEHLAEQAQAQMVLIGRSDWTAKHDEVRARIERAGGTVRYVRGDVTDVDDVATAASLARELGPLSGVLHLAGVNEDTYIVNKAPGAHRRVLAPKLVGARNLDLVTKDDRLDAFVVFSSLAAYLGAPGQSDYAAAGRALGGFASRRASDVAAGRRSGTTVSIAWPLWAEGGMKLSDEDTQASALLQGITAMPTQVGFTAMLAALGMGLPEVLVAHGDGAKTKEYVSKRIAERPQAAASTKAPATSVQELVEVERYLLDVVSEVTRIPVDQLQPDQEFSAIGVDSVLIKRLSVVLEQRLEPLPVTLLFEQRTVREVANYLVEHHGQALRAAVGTVERPITVAAPKTVTRKPQEAPSDGIAIIGVAGRYPGARDLDKLWEMLAAGKSAISEVPAERWDNSRYFEPEERRPGAIYGRWGGFLQDVRRFDSLFFAVAPREAERMDPAERLFLEVAWSAIEDAGYTRTRLHRSTRSDEGHSIGVYVGTTGMSYQLVGAEEWGRGNPVSAYSMDFSLANRLSYFLDAHGPSIVVDTACSASLTALHLACDALRNGDCRVAIAGGAYLNLHPSKFAMLSEQRMISRDGTLRAFGDGANGFVPGEGIGAVVLKPLSAAIADGDHIHAIIRGTAIQHGGKTNGYTVPNPQGHAAVIRAALDRAGVDPRSIGYVEAHGTGTELGDPIEFDGLSRVFRQYTADNQFCALGSVKTNIGHAEAAAGIAGLTKIILQLRHRTLTPTLNSDIPNSRIDFSNSPFRLQHSVSAWHEPAPDGPRRAAVSSFGAGGANAHVVVEEHLSSSGQDTPDQDEAQVILLSARTRDRLEAVADRLVSYLARPEAAGSLREIAYTLQVGREAFEHRLAVTVSSLEELRERLSGLRHAGSAPGVSVSRVDDSKRPTADLPRVQRLLEDWRWNDLASLWLSGAPIDWEVAWKSERMATVSLPTYPFAGPEHWPATTDAQERTTTQSDIAVQLRRQDPVITDHLVDGRPVLAGVAQLELARAAAAGALTEANVLTDVRWRVPLEVDGRAIVARLSTPDESVRVEIVSRQAETEIVHSTMSVTSEQLAALKRLDIAAVKNRLARPVSGAALYINAEALGLRYGTMYRGVQTLWSGDGEALAELDSSVSHPKDWRLAPGLLDAALHTIHGALPDDAATVNVPASVARVELYGSTDGARYAHAQLVDFSSERGIARFDVTLADAHGQPLVVFKDFRAVRRAEEMPYFRPVWRVRPLQTVSDRSETQPVLVMTTNHDFGLGDALVSSYGKRSTRIAVDDEHREVPVPSTIYFLGGVEDRRYTPADMEYLGLSQRTGSLALFRLAQMLAAQRARGVRLVVVTNDAQQTDEGTAFGNPFAASLHGLARAISRELPFLDVVCVDLDGADLAQRQATGDWSSLLSQLAVEPASSPMAEVALRGGVHLEKTLVRAMVPEPEADQLPFRRGGRYLIVGGAGGLGRTISEYLAREYDAKLMLVGRRNADELPDGFLAVLRACGGEARYLAADVTDPDSMRVVVAQMRAEFGGVDGVIHSAFVLADRTIAQMDEATFAAALDPKVRGTVALCEAIATEDLDFLALFSSAIAHTGNPGQSNYAAGSTFQDAFGRYAASRLHLPVKVINWGFWGERGAVATDEYRERLAQAGVSPISEAEGVRAFHRVLGNAIRQISPLKADGSLAQATVVDSATVHLAGQEGRSVLEGVHQALVGQLSAAGEPYSANYLEAVDRFSRKLIFNAMNLMGALPSVGEHSDVAELATAIHVAPQQRKLFDALLTALANGGYVRRAGTEIETLPSVSSAETENMLRADLVARFPHLHPTLDLLAECADALPEVLTGARRGLELLFPGGSDKRMSTLYHDDPRVKHFNALCTTAVLSAVEAMLPTGNDQPLRILEIGAGTGGTSKPVLHALEPHASVLRYDYTDISPTLVNHAQDRFSDVRSYVDFRVLDIGGDLAEQGFESDQYDIVLATNVLHATPDIRKTLGNVSRLMAPGAVLVVNEATRVLDSITLIFGLTDGWWQAEDSHLRLPASPLLGIAEWKAVLNEAGLQGVRPYGVSSWSQEQAGQHLLIAERDRWTTVVQRATERHPTSPTVAAAAETAANPQRESTHERTVEYLIGLCAALLKVPVDELEPDLPLSNYGADSLITMELQERIERDLGSIPTDLANRGSVAAIAEGLLATQADELVDRFAEPAPPVAQELTPHDDSPTAQHVLEPIAVIGVAGRYPGAEDLEAFWANLVAGHSAITADKPTRMASTPGQDGYHQWGAHLADVECFDPLLFRISPNEAERIDPSERWFLQIAWEALEDAGQPPSRLQRASASGRPKVGVFVGAMHAQYEMLALQQAMRGNEARALSARWSIANRVSHTFGFVGPSMAVDTACSSALTAVHLAVESLRRGECTTALAGGVNLILHPSHDQALATAKMLSDDGSSRAFDPNASGMVTGEGVGAVVLKRLSDAVRDGDRIHACIVASQVNADGGSGAYAVPSAAAQGELLSEALRTAGLAPSAVQYVEAHALGSPVGDPKEAEALSQVFGGTGLVVGSLKPNIGHLEAASGMAQLTKVLLQLRHRTLAPTIGAASSPSAAFQVVRVPTAWRNDAPGTPRRAAVSSFGAGGANAHLILEEAPDRASADVGQGSGPWIFVLSARKPERLRAYASKMRDFLQRDGAELSIADLTHTLQVGRQPLRARLGWVVRSVREAIDRLDTYVRENRDGSDEFVDGSVEGSLLKAWLAGGDVDWSQLNAGRGSRIVSLPHYPFARDRYWLGTADPVSALPQHPEERTVTMPHGETGSDLRVPSAEFREEVIAAIADVIGVQPSDIDEDDRLSDFGFDSVTMVTLAGRLSELLKADVNPAVLYGYPDVTALIRDLSPQHSARIPGGSPTVMPAEPPPPSAVASTPRAAPSVLNESRPLPPERQTEPVAVVGMTGAFPGSPTVESFWENLIAGRDLIGEIPADRFEDHTGETRARWGGFLSDIDKFDAEFFQITPREARLMDPHHRLFLQTVWAAIEESGHDPAELAGSACGVYVGVASSEYAQLARVRGVEIDGQLATGNDHSMVANRVSFLLDLRGPSEPVDTACSSSLVAIDRAVRSIQSGQCDMAIAGGVNVILTPDAFDAFGSSGMLAPDGRCKAFDHRADGYVRGEGVGALLLKPLSKAIADGDHIHALITGSATNHGGRANSLTAPNPAAQADVIVKAHAAAEIDPETIGYVETHGTGTALGDPIEVAGLRTAFGKPSERQQCGLGSVKTNVGHLETAAGIAGVIKVIMSLRHRLLPPTLHVEKVNPLIELSDSQFYLVTSPRPWERLDDSAPRRAGVSSFGYGGMNAHVIVEEPPAQPARSSTAGPQLFVLSARDEDRLRAQATQLVQYISRLEMTGGGNAVSPSDVAYTLQVGRTGFHTRLALVADTLSDVGKQLQAHLDGSPDSIALIGHGAPGSGEGLERDELEHLISRALAGQFKGLAKAWVNGAQVDWTRLHTDVCRRVSLPTYPFSKERHWLPEPARRPAVPESKTSVAPSTFISPPPLPPMSAPTVTTAEPPQATRNGYAATSTSTSLHRHVREAVAEGIGIAVDEVDPLRDFAAYGVDSIGALRIMQHIQSRYGDHIPMAAILEHANVDLLVAHLAENYVLPDAPPGSGETPGVNSSSTTASVKPRLVRFNEKAAAGTPTYCLFGDTGELSWLLHLQEGLATQGPVIGVEAPGFAEGQEPAGDIEELADQCADLIISDHTEGPCRVVGYGLAGFVAAEAARTLMHRGVEISELLLIGTPEPALDPRSESTASSVSIVASMFASAWGAAHPVEPQDVPDGEISRQVAVAVEKLSPVSPMAPQTLQQWLEQAVHWRMSLLRAASAYRPRPITGAGSVTVVRTARQGNEPEHGDFDRWIAPPPVVRELDCPSWMITSADAVREIAQTVAQPPGRPAAERSSLVAINRFGAAPRSFWAHNLYGEVSYAIYLSKHLGMGKPVMGLEQIDVGSRVREYGSVVEMAEHYTAELREQHQGEPFILGGCSFGGVLAYEVARQLQVAGEQVSRLIAIDPIMPGTAAWDSVDWGQVTEIEAESFSIVLLGNASCQRWGVAERITLEDLAHKSIDEQLDVVARHIIERSPARPDSNAIRRQIRVRHDLMMQNNVLLQEYRPAPLAEPIPTTLFHATQGFLAADNDNDLPPVPRSNADPSNGFAQFVGDRLVIHELEADHFTIAYDHNLTRIAKLVAPLLENTSFPAGTKSR